MSSRERQTQLHAYPGTGVYKDFPLGMQLYWPKQCVVVNSIATQLSSQQPFPSPLYVENPSAFFVMVCQLQGINPMILFATQSLSQLSL